MNRWKKRLTRTQFEKLIQGDWQSVHGDRQRINGPFVTLVTPGQKHFVITAQKGEPHMVSKSTWLAIAKELLIGDYGMKLGD